MFVVAVVTLLVPRASNAARNTSSSLWGWLARSFLKVQFPLGLGFSLCDALQSEFVLQLSLVYFTVMIT